MLFENKILISGLAILGLLYGSTAAQAGPAQATTNVNVRTGPGVSFAKIGKLKKHERVDATECHKDSWCYVKYDGENGWVSIKYLTAVPKPNNNQGKNCKFVFSLNNNGPSFNLECEEPQPQPQPNPFEGEGENENDVPIYNDQQNDSIATACLYTGINYTGAEICEGVSTHKNLRGMNDIFASVKLFNGAAIKLCSGIGFTGKCKTYAKDRARLHADIYKKASSMRVFTQFENASNNAVLPNEIRPISSRIVGQIVLRNNQRADLDTGKLAFADADVQYARASNGKMYLRALDGTKFSIGKRNNRGYKGCSVANYNSVLVRKSQMPVGSYICVKTNDGSVSQIRANQYGISRVTLGFETFK